MADSELANKANLEKNDTIEHEPTRLMLDATPLACRLMKRTDDGRYEIFECNEESVKLFKFKNKQEFMERYFEIYPEYQPNGKKSVDEGQRYFNEAYNKSKCTMNFVFQTIDGEPVPTEVTLVRLKYGDEYVIAGYSRDMREHNRMMEDIKSRNRLLNMGNHAVQTLLTVDDDSDIEKALLESLEIVGRSVDGDRVQIFQNIMVDGSLHYVQIYEWLSDVGKEKAAVPVYHPFPYSGVPRWEEIFTRGGYINGPVSDLPAEEQQELSDYGIKTMVAIPLIIKSHFWGFLTIDDCEEERTFSKDEITLLRSVSQMFVSALNRNAQAIEIREAHKRVLVLLERVPFACHIWNSDIELIDCNEENCRLFGIKDTTEIIENWENFVPVYQNDGQKSVELARTLIKKAFAEDRYICEEFIYLTAAGTPVPTEITLVRIPMDNDFVVAAYLRDLREQKAMMQEIEQRSNLLDNLNKAANILLQSDISDFEENLHTCMGMIGNTVSADRVCLWKNRVENGKLHIRLAFEWPGGAETGINRDGIMDISYDDDLPGWKEFLSKGECINSVVSGLTLKGKARHVAHDIKSLFVAPIHVRGEFWGFVGFDDLSTEKVLFENEASTLRSGSLLIANALLRNEMLRDINESNIKLEAALKETQRANDAKSDFLANMSHEMRTPLNAIIGLSGLSLENTEMDGDTRSNLEKVYTSGDMLLSIVNDILDISKIEAGKMILIELEYDVPSLINDTVTQNILRIGEKPIKFKLDITADLFSRLHGDELRVKQIMNNILSNAIKYTEEGSIELGFHCERDETDDSKVWLTIKVSDTGRGIRREDMVKLFRDYSQLDLETTRQMEGTGLGLPITKNLAEMMQGTISVESEYGEGSVFTVKILQHYISDITIGREVVENLRSFRYADEKRDRHTKIKRISMPYARVLVVDDNITNLDVAKGLMKPYHMEIDCVTGGLEAIDLIRSEEVRYDAIFMDHMMPGLDGIQTTRIIREEIETEYAKSIPIIALTANAISGNEALFLSKGFQAFIPKPIEITRLDKVIRQFVRDKSKEYTGKETDKETDNESILSEKRLFEDIDIPGLDVTAGVERFGDDEEEYLRILRSYADNTAPLLEKIQTPDKDTLPDYAIIVHGIKGASRGIVAGPVGDFAEQMEKAAKAGNYDYVIENNDGLIACVDNLINDIQALLKHISLAKPKPLKTQIDREMIRKLFDACNRFDMDGVDQTMKEITGFQYETDGDFVAWLTEKVKQMNLGEIAEKLSSMQK